MSLARTALVRSIGAVACAAALPLTAACSGSTDSATSASGGSTYCSAVKDAKAATTTALANVDDKQTEQAMYDAWAHVADVAPAEISSQMQWYKDAIKDPSQAVAMIKDPRQIAIQKYSATHCDFSE
ncbi:hypothetical protein [Gordonia spumicola]|nr:hypothetical protein [Gordonia spumicola]